MAEKTSRKKTAIVIGAGVGGVSTAARLAKAGFQVTVLEKNEFTGGRCSLIYHDASSDKNNNNAYRSSKPPPSSTKPNTRQSTSDTKTHPPKSSATTSNPNTTYRFDQGPSLLLLPQLFHRTFQELGTSLEQEGVILLKCEPNYNIWFGDGERFRLSSDLAVMKSEIERWEGKAGYERYLQFLQESHRHYELSLEHVLLRNFTSLLSMLRPAFLRRLFELHPFESIWTRASRYFWTERLRRVFTFGSMYMGMSPFDAPGTYSLLQYTELAEGIWYPVGGFHKVVEALVKVGEREGVEYRLGREVRRIVLDESGGRAKGVELEDGTMLEADVVVNNSDLVYAYSNLLPESDYARNLKQRPGSCSSISFYWALDREVPELEAHNIFLADDYKESFDAIFKKHLIPDEPSFYVNVPSRVDSTAAPEGKDSVVVLVPVGHLLEDKEREIQPITGTAKTQNGHISAISPATEPGLKPTASQNWPAMVALARKTILGTIAARTGVELGKLIVHEESNDPSTWQERFNLDRGAILGLSHSFFNVLCFRPSTQARRGGAWDALFAKLGVVGRVAEVVVDVFRGRGRDVRGLYMVGASAHPGTGVPICLAGGAIVAEQVCQDYGVAIPWKGEGRKVVRNGSLDREERPGSLGRGLMMILVVLVVLGILMSDWGRGKGGFDEVMRERDVIDDGYGLQ